MSEMHSTVKVSILGNEYTIKGEADDTYIQELARYVDQKMREISQNTNLATPLKISILTAINLADEIFRLRTKHAQKELELNNNSSLAPEALSALISHIETALNDEKVD